MTDPVRHATVVGAGLAGAALAHALVARGWRVDLLDAAGKPDLSLLEPLFHRD